MNTNKTNGNNSEIFEAYAQESAKAPVEILGTFIGNGVEATIRARSIIINDRKGDGSILHKYSESRGAMTALIDGWHIGKYPVLQLGLHLIYSFETLRKFSRKDMVGYLTSMYDGDNIQLLRLRPESGVVVLGTVGGVFQVKERIAEPPANHFDESDDTTRRRSVFWKHTAMDAIINGEKLVIAPFLYKKVKMDDSQTNPLAYSPERVEAFLAQYAESLKVSPAEAGRRSYQAGLTRIYRKQDGLVNAQVNAGILPLPEGETVKVGEAVINITDLLGKTVIKSKGNIVLGKVAVNPSNLAGLLASVQKNNIALAFLS